MSRRGLRPVEHMGDDSSFVQAARVSYGKGTKTVSDERGLIRHLVRDAHTTPLEMVEFKFRVRVPMDCWRQWIRHRAASVNEYSTRYSEAIDSATIEVGRGPRASPQGFAAEHVHRGVLEDRPAQPVSLRAAAEGLARTA